MNGRTFNIIVRVSTMLGALAIGAMMLATCWDIVARMVANKPLRGVVELVEIMVLASAMLGLPETFLREDQITVDVIDSIVPAKILVIIRTIAIVLAMILLLIFSINVLQPMLDAYRFGDLKYDLGVPVYPLYGLIIFTFGLSILSCIGALLRLLSPNGALDALDALGQKGS